MSNFKQEAKCIQIKTATTTWGN